MKLVLEIAAGVILGGIGLYVLRLIAAWVALEPWRQRTRRLNKQPMTDLQFAGILALVTAACIAATYFLGGFR